MNDGAGGDEICGIDPDRAARSQARNSRLRTLGTLDVPKSARFHHDSQPLPVTCEPLNRTCRRIRCYAHGIPSMILSNLMD